jgi:hypothetical protein
VVAIVGVIVLYSLLILFAQFVAQGVVEEKSSRVVELLLATMRPWQLLAGKILGLGRARARADRGHRRRRDRGALAFDVVELPGELVGTVLWLLFWFVLGYALFASLFAVAASLVSRQEDLGSVLTPASLVLGGRASSSPQAASDPRSDAGGGHLLRAGAVADGHAGAPGRRRRGAVGGRGGVAAHARGHRAGGPPRRAGVLRRAAAHGGRTKRQGGASGPGRT